MGVDLLFKRGNGIPENKVAGTLYHSIDTRTIYLDDMVLEDSNAIKDIIVENELVTAAALTKLNETKADIEALAEYALQVSIPTKTSQLENDSNFLVASDLEGIDLTGYATESWVQDQGYLTSHQDISHLATKLELAEKADKTEIKTYTISKVTEGLAANILERYVLSDGTNSVGDAIDIYKDSSLKSAELINQKLVFTYTLADDTEQVVEIDVSTFLTQAEFKNGLSVNENGEVSVKVDATSEAFLTVDAAGVKLAGVQDAIDTVKAEILGDYSEIEEEFQCKTLSALNTEMLNNELIASAALTHLNINKIDRDEVDTIISTLTTEIDSKIDMTALDGYALKSDIPQSQIYVIGDGNTYNFAELIEAIESQKILAFSMNMEMPAVPIHILNYNDEMWMGYCIGTEQYDGDNMPRLQCKVFCGNTESLEMPQTFDLTQTNGDGSAFLANDGQYHEIVIDGYITEDWVRENIIGDFNDIEEEYQLNSFTQVSKTIIDNELAISSALTDLKNTKLDSEIYTNQITNLQSSLDTKVDNTVYNTKISSLEGMISEKQDVLTAGNGITINDNTISCTLEANLYETVTELPTENINSNKIYILLNTTSTDDNNIHEEYMYVNNVWEKVGESQSHFATKDALQELQDEVINNELVIAEALTQLNDNKAEKSDVTLLDESLLELSSALNTKADITILQNYALASSIPANTSDLVNDSGFITAEALEGIDLTGYATEEWVNNQSFAPQEHLNTLENHVNESDAVTAAALNDLNTRLVEKEEIIANLQDKIATLEQLIIGMQEQLENTLLIS